MAKTNCRKRRNKFATKSGKGKEVWMDIFFFFFVNMQILLCPLCIPSKGREKSRSVRWGGGGGGSERMSEGFGIIGRMLEGLEDDGVC